MDQQTMQMMADLSGFFGSTLVTALGLTVVTFVGALLARPALLFGAVSTNDGRRRFWLLMIRWLLWIAFVVLVLFDLVAFAFMMVANNMAGGLPSGG